jgi:hypothetical protein
MLGLLRSFAAQVSGGIHPHNKTEVGRRLALEIRAKVFGKRNLPRITRPVDPIPRPSPRSDEPLMILFTREGASSSSSGGGSTDHAGGLRLTWGPTHNCSVCCGPSTEVVEVCQQGCESQTSTSAWRVTGATWDHQRGGLQPQTVAGVAAVRYAWSNFPECVLFDEHGLPVGPFNITVEPPLPG